VNSSDDAILSKTFAGIITNWNPAAQRIYGYAAEEIIGQSVTRLILPDRLGEFTEITRQL
jgi:PAS domain S-box-containing protein